MKSPEGANLLVIPVSFGEGGKCGDCKWIGRRSFGWDGEMEYYCRLFDWHMGIEDEPYRNLSCLEYSGC